MMDLIREGVIMSSLVWGSYSFGPQKGVPDDSGREYMVEISGFLMTRKPKRKREKKPRTLVPLLLPIDIP